MAAAAAGAAPVDCKECARQFPTFKVYIKHLLAKECGAAQDQAKAARAQEQTKLARAHSLPGQVAPPSRLQAKKPLAKPAKESCGMCGKLCKGSRGLASHNTSSHTCHYCSQASPSLHSLHSLQVVADLPAHVREEHERQACAHCSSRFATADALEEHVRKTHIVTCEICQEDFTSEEDMVEHRREEHETEECDMCQQKFLKTDKLLEAHLAEEHGIKTKTIREFGGGAMFMMME